jgi:hypothetical protein
MKSIQISPMFISLTGTEEESLCGGESTVVSKGLYDEAKVYKKTPGNKGAKKQTVTSSTVTSTKKVVETSKDVKVLDLDILDELFSLFDW